MSTVGDFSEEEWLELRRLPVLAAALISAVDYSKLSEAHEDKAFAGFVEKAALKNQNSPVIAAVLEDLRSQELLSFQKHCEYVATAMGGENPVDDVLRLATRVAQTVDAQLSKKEAKKYKAFIMDVAVVVARAHKESILPLASAVSSVEDFHLRRLSHALGY